MSSQVREELVGTLDVGGGRYVEVSLAFPSWTDDRSPRIYIRLFRRNPDGSKPEHSSAWINLSRLSDVPVFCELLKSAVSKAVSSGGSNETR